VGKGGEASCSLNLAPDGIVLSASRHRRFTTRKKPSYLFEKRLWWDFRDDLDADKRKGVLCFYLESNPFPSVVQPIAELSKQERR
jgi:hypothetical protein